MNRKYIAEFFKLILVAFFCMSISSCKKDEDKFEAPTGTRISTIKNLKEPINGGDMGDWIAIHGSNLKSTEMILFNDVEADIKQMYFENDIMYLQVPVKMPVDISNKLVVKTKGGEVSYDFLVSIPNLEMTSMFNEYTLPGDTIKLYGKFLRLYEVDSLNTVVSFGGVESKVIEVGETYLTAKVPDNVQSDVKVKVINSKFNATAVCPGYYQDKHNVITTFDADFPYKGTTGAQWVGAWPNPKPTSNKYLRFEVDQASYPNGIGWFYLFESDMEYTLDMVQHPEKYLLKFELNMAFPIQRTSFFLYYYWAVAASPLGSESFTVQTPGLWQTVAIPLEKIIPMGNTGTSTSYSLNMRIENNAPVERVAMFFDNFRVYKKGE